ncbi:hypothetical protein [Streptomyces sp. Ag109_G2-15]|uniref:hypothetical protein n=1 Tax=Streptomyces sp. Ag109_G2-15 TaxID=1938850 RepID=UPI00211C65CF|nr:hypothetical protein [Streptomyces sp. Ag109_G2-15]
MLRISGGHGNRSSHRGGPDPRRLRLLALLGVVVGVVALPLAVASAGQVGDAAGSPGAGGGAGVHAPSSSSLLGDAKMPSVAPTRSPLLLGLGVATAARCGPELSSPEGVEAQTCVLTQGEDTWARTYYRNTSGEAVDSVLSLMEPAGRTVQTHCATDAADEPATCETPRERTRGSLDGYTAVAEFAAHGADGPLLLRSGSNSEETKGS